MSSVCHLFLAVAVSLLIGISARYEDCENPPAVAHASVQSSDDEDSVRASYTCAEGYELSGSTELICNLDTDEWDSDPPSCVKVSEVSNEVESVKAIENPRKRKPKEIPENPKVPHQMASTLDMSCIQAKVKAPEIRYGFVENYDRRRSGDHVYLVAFYACNDRFEFEDSDISEVYCSDRKWVGELPVCIAVGEYGEGNEEEEYEEYDPVDEDNLEGNNLDEQQLTPPQPAMSSEPGNAISSYDAVRHVTPQNLEEANVIKEDEAAKDAVTDINIIVEATRDPFLPRVLDQECGRNNGDCEHKCERLLYPGENEPRLKCSCFDGFSLDPYDYSRCHDVDECLVNNGGCEQICKNLPGSFECACQTGLQIDTLTGHSCVDINECESSRLSEQCPDGCENTHGSFRCIEALNSREDATEIQNAFEGVAEKTCPPGFEAADGKDCEDIDECALGISGCEHCRNMEGSFECTCPEGYELAQDARTCSDIDECASVGTHSCSHVCLNTDGGYQCSCPGGYRFIAGSTEKCEDIDECQSKSDLCGALDCVNTPGSFMCVCPDGSDPHTETGDCEVIVVDLCAEANGGCSHICLNEQNGTRCMCPNGMLLSEDGRRCIYEDRCAENNGGCEQLCTEGRCACRQGFVLQEDGAACADVDECGVNNGGCHQVCRNHEGSYECACDAGFELADDRATCIDVDECALGRHDCSHKCVNLEGGYECVCPRNHVLGANKATCLENTRDLIPAMARCPAHAVPNANGDCVPLKRFCLSNNGNCSHNCDELIGCTCPDGLELAPDDKSCTDIDECLLRNGGCSHICVNTFGSYQCACQEGARLTDARHCAAASAACPSGFRNDPADASNCLDIDECATPGICQYSCINYNGSYACVCPKGYTLRNGRECEDIDECLRNNGGCSGGGVCVNLRGSYQCQCHAGYSLRSDGHTCEASTESWRDQCSQLVAPPNGEVHCTKYRHKKMSYYSTKCKIWCRPGYRLQGAAYRYCDSSGAWDQQESQCIPIVCPRIPAPSNGVILPASCSYGKTYFGERCRLQCHPGYVPVRNMVAVCTASQAWSTNTTLACVPYELNVYLPHLYGSSRSSSSTNTTTNQFFSTSFLPAPPVVPSAIETKPSLTSAIGTSKPTQPRFTLDPVAFDTPRPYIKCPRNTTVVLAQGARTAHIILQKPVTNMDFRYIESYPSWTKDLQAHLAAGTYFITFRGHDPATRRRARCQTVIQVRNAEPPKVDFCPLSFEVTLNPNEVYRPVYWEEPRFEGDAGRRLKKMYKSRIPGELFGSGVHTVYYDATNEDELTARCEFQIVVKAAKPQPSLPLIDFGLTQASRITDRLQSQVSYAAEKDAQMSRANLLVPGHDAYIICPGRAPVKVIDAESVNLRAECVLKNMRVQSSRRQLQRQYSFGRHTSKYYA